MLLISQLLPGNISKRWGGYSQPFSCKISDSAGNINRRKVLVRTDIAKWGSQAIPVAILQTPPPQPPQNTLCPSMPAF